MHGSWFDAQDGRETIGDVSRVESPPVELVSSKPQALIAAHLANSDSLSPYSADEEVDHEHTES